jgi:hypothetical protein
VQAKLVVPLTPVVADAIVALEEQCGYAQASQSRAQTEASLTSTN